MRPIRSVSPIALATVLSAALFAFPAAAQDGTYEAALESGDLATLIPEQFADAEMMAGTSFEGTLGPSQIDTPDGAAAREELLALAGAAGLTLADVTTITGFTGDEQAFTSFSATRLPGILAGDWFELFYQISMFRSYADPVREIIPVGPKQVLRITDRGSSRSDLLYAQGEILWQLSGDDEPGVEFLEALATIDGSVLSADPGALVDGQPVAQIGTAQDPLSQIPPQILDATTTTQTFPASAIFANVDQSNAEDVAIADRLMALLESAGGVDRATIISSQAVTDSDGVNVLGLHVEGADHAAFSDGFVELFLLSEFDDPQRDDEQLGGKAVVRVSEAGSLLDQPRYVYGVGGTVWILGGPDEYIAALLRTMP